MDNKSPRNEIHIKSSIHKYKVSFGSFRDEMLTKVSIVDFNICELHLKDIDLDIHAIKVSEEIKNIETVLGIVDYLVLKNLKKSDVVTVVGGGVIQDIATLATSIYMRGVPWRYVPTTLQAMIDSCVGGKSSINHSGAKNILGNFYPPTEILVDVNFLATLTKTDIVCGLIEGAKICAASGTKELKQFLSIADSLSTQYLKSDEEHWFSLVNYVLLQKKIFVEADEFDQNIRKLLNFGHTFGHAIEASTNFAVPHGVAVGIGILIASDFSNEDAAPTNNLLNPYIERVLDSVISDYLAILNSLDRSKFLEALGKDKKGQHGHYNFIVTTPVGLSLSSHEISERTNNRILGAFQHVMTRWGSL